MKKQIAYSIIAGLALSSAAMGETSDTPTAVSTVTPEDLSNTTNEDILKRLQALEENRKTSLSSWTSKVRMKGDVRYRFQYVEAEDEFGADLSTSKNIQRLRVRLGAYADVNDFTTAGVGIRTGNKANSGNVTLGDNFDGFDLSISLAYFAIAPVDAKYGTATFGKMKQTWFDASNLIWDSDVNPEGIAYAYDGKAGDTGIFGSLGYFRVQEESLTTDMNLGQGQLGVIQPIGKTKLTIGGSFYGYDNSQQFTDPVLPGNYAVDYSIAEAFATLSVKDVGPIPFKFYGNYVNNTATGNENTGYCIGIKFGDAKKGKWQASYNYRDLGLYAAPAYFTDSDFADGGTGVKGSSLKAKYNIAKNLACGATFIYSKRTPVRTLKMDQQFNTLMLDLMVSF
ncbi:putative porin [Pontiellaceae bacterium B12219]|nr:putative porin [Pontiellaceae bacterium B12219]